MDNQNPDQIDHAISDATRRTVHDCGELGNLPQTIQWPGSGGGAVTISLSPELPGRDSTVTVPGPISTMTWEVDMLTDRIATRDGWWLVETTSDTAADGYSSQTMTVWNTDGRPVMANRQNVAAFI